MEHQTVCQRVGDIIECIELPPPEAKLLDDVRWGDVGSPMSAAFWYSQVWFDRRNRQFAPRPLGRNLVEEVAACLLGGYGMPAELGWAAFLAVGQAGLLERVPSTSEILDVLSRPLRVGDETRRYRFAERKSRYLAGCLARLRSDDVPLDPLELRDYLTTLPGIGLKTASWVVRNRYACDDVAILDVHVVRLCKALGVFPATADPQRQYREMEKRFVALARAMKVGAAHLDNLIWHNMKIYGRAIMS